MHNASCWGIQDETQMCIELILQHVETGMIVVIYRQYAQRNMYFEI